MTQTVETILSQYISSNLSISVYPMVSPLNAAYPFVVYSRRGGQTMMTMDGPSYRRESYTFNVRAKTMAMAESYRGEIISLLSGLVDGQMSVLNTAEMNDYDEITDVYMADVDFDVINNTAMPTVEVITGMLSSSYGNSVTASFALTAQSASYALSASWAPFSNLNAVSASYALTASYASNGGNAYNPTGSLFGTASWASNSVSSSWAPTASLVPSASFAISASYAPATPSVSASYSVTSSWAPNPLITGNNTYYLSNFSATPMVSGSDIMPSLRLAFAAISASNVPATLYIPAGSYMALVAGPSGSVVAPNNLTVIADGVTVTYPNSITGSVSYPSPSFITGTDVQNFLWRGGNFIGNVFNQYLPNYLTNLWQPKEGVITFNFGTSVTGCNNCEWDNVAGLDTGGSVVRVIGTNSAAGGGYSYNYTNVLIPCTNIRLRDCNFINCGQFLWDYGWLWQVMSFQSQYTANQVAMATAYFWPNCLYGTVGMLSGSTNVTFNNSGTALPVIPVAPNNTQAYNVTFYTSGSGALPSNITNGLQYYVSGSSSTGIQIASTFGGPAIAFASSATGSQMIFNITNAFYNLFEPVGCSGTADGAWSISNSNKVLVADCVWSAPGDSHFFCACTDTDITGCQCLNAQMGVLWISGCLRTTVTGGRYNADLIWGGSRSLTVEFGSTDTILNGVTFNGGRRGVLLDSPNGLQITNCKFSNNNNGGSVGGYQIGRIYPTNAGYATFSCFTLESTGNVPWYGVTFTGNNIFSNSALNVCDIEYTGSGLIWDLNYVSGSHTSINNNHTSVSNVYVGRGVGLIGYHEAQYNGTIVSSSLISLGWSFNQSVQSSNGVDFLAWASPCNAASPQPTYVYADINNVYIVIPQTSATVQYAWGVQAIMT